MMFANPIVSRLGQVPTGVRFLGSAPLELAQTHDAVVTAFDQHLRRTFEQQPWQFPPRFEVKQLKVGRQQGFVLEVCCGFTEMFKQMQTFLTKQGGQIQDVQLTGYSHDTQVVLIHGIVVIVRLKSAGEH